MKLAIGCDHRGIELKKNIMVLLTELGHDVIDFGAFKEDAIDYPDIANPLARGVARGEFKYGILVCATGIGMSIAANKVKGIRAALCCNAASAELTRRHNDANILCLAAINNTNENLTAVNTFLVTPFEGGRHLRRVEKIAEIEKTA